MTDPHRPQPPVPPGQGEGDPWAPPQGNAAEPPPPPAAPEDLRARGRLGVWLAAGAAASSLLLAPLGGLLLGVGAAIVGARARARARAARVALPTATAAVIVGALSATLAISAITLQVIFYDELSTYRDCMDAANTEISSDACREAFEDSVPEWAEALR